MSDAAPKVTSASAPEPVFVAPSGHQPYGSDDVAAVLLLCAGAWAARMVFAIVMPTIHHPDEVFQSLEQAHRLVFGNGLIPWEFLYGTRSWLLPGAVAGILWVARFLGDGPTVYLPILQGVLSALSCVSVLCAFLWGRRAYGLAGGLMAALPVAYCIDPIYFSGRALSEVVAAHLLVLALYLAHPGYLVSVRARLFSAGILFGMVAMLRVQFAPAVLVAVLWSPPVTWRARLPALVLGGVLAAAFSGAIDYATWGTPFLSTWRNFSFNLLHGVSSSFGEHPWFLYFGFIAAFWGGAAATLLLAVGIAAPKRPLLLALMLAILAAHIAIAHKEYRFIYPLVLLATIMAGDGLVLTLRVLIATFPSVQLGGSREQRLFLVSSGVLLLVFFLGQATSRVTLSSDGPSLQHNSDIVQAALWVSSAPNVCGIASHEIGWSAVGGYSYLHQPVPYYWLELPNEWEEFRRAFNTLIFRKERPPASLDGYVVKRCFRTPVEAGERVTCVAQRPGACEHIPMKSMPIPEPLTNVAPLWRP